VPFEEDTWRDFKIGNQNFSAVKPCARCVLTTINQDSAEKGTEPLRTLATYRTINRKVMFGQNLLPRSGDNFLQTGSSISVLSYRE
ncbi:MAG: MOSC domain-containing protein, partial [Bacteroidota bacterium]|nr:MOSC domain-containing protein [Bacteroidota bacterium]